jgi:hypothetical protein
MLKIEFDTDNDAFSFDKGLEIEVILKKTLCSIKYGNTSGKCFDSNGNSVGKWSIN